MHRCPVRRRPASLEQAGGTAEQGTRAHGKYPAGATRLLGYPAKHLSVLHQSLLTKPTRHMEDIEQRCISQRRVRREQQPLEIANRCERLAVDAVRYVRDSRQHLEWSGQVDLINTLK